MEQKEYLTDDPDLAAFLMSQGWRVRSYSEDGRAIWKFEHSKALQTDVENFLNDLPVTVKVRSLCENIRRLRISIALLKKGGVQR